MSDRVHRRQPATLPEGYQYGDVSTLTLAAQMRALAERHAARCKCGSNCTLAKVISSASLDVSALEAEEKLLSERWRAPHENAAAQLKRRASTFRLGVDTCPTCGTNGKYDCPDCGIPFYAKRNAQRTGEETI